jgi:uncharacterized surface protein with fasciclin (FAS1) repeats
VLNGRCIGGGAGIASMFAIDLMRPGVFSRFADDETEARYSRRARTLRLPFVRLYGVIFMIVALAYTIINPMFLASADNAELAIFLGLALLVCGGYIGITFWDDYIRYPAVDFIALFVLSMLVGMINVVLYEHISSLDSTLHVIGSINKLIIVAFAALTLGTAVQAANIVEIAAGDDRFTTLVAAVRAADLVETLSGPGPFTVFAPINAAFAKLPAGTVEELLKPENKAKLAAILTYHVVAGKVLAADVKPGEVKTVNGKPATISIKDGAPYIDGAKIIATDLVGSNGVVHVIDSVILP